MSSKDYVAGRVSAALAEAKGNAAAARQMLIAECGRDTRLLQGLVASYLPGIVAHAVNRAGEARPKRRKAELPADALETVVGQLGKAIGETRLPRGMTALIDPPSRPAAGTRHQDALRQLADSYKQKRQAF